MAANAQQFELAEIPSFLNHILDKTTQLCKIPFDVEPLEEHAVTLDKTISLLRQLEDCFQFEDNEKAHLQKITSAFDDILQGWNHLLSLASITTTTVANLGSNRQANISSPGRSSYNISSETLEELRGFGFTWGKIAKILGVSRWTVLRRVEKFGLQEMREFSHITDQELDELVRNHISNHGATSGQGYIAGYIKSLGLRVQRRRIRESMTRVDPQNTAIRWGAQVSRRTYQVPWPNSLWHLDGHHSLIRWKLVIHGCIDGFSRRIMFLKCSSNNLAQTVLNLFLDVVNKDGNRWPSRIRVDKGVENVLVCEAMIEARGEGRGSFIAGPSTHNQRIERLWRDVYRCICHQYYYIFYAMESTGLLNIDDPLRLLTLHLIFLPRINKSLGEFLEGFNHHKVRTEKNWSPYQMWLNGMLHSDNPLSHGLLDEEPSDVNFYGYDAQGPTCLGDDNNVVVEPIEFEHTELLKSYVLASVDPLVESNDMGVDLFCKALDIVQAKIKEISAS